MNQEVEILAEVQKTVKAKLGNVTANVTTNGGRVSRVDNGQVFGEEGQQTATFSKYEGSQLNVEFYTNGYANTITAIENFINAVNEE